MQKCVTWGLRPHFRFLHSQSMKNVHVDAGLTRPGLCVDNQTVQPTCATSWHGGPGTSGRRDAVPPGKATAIMIATHCESLKSKAPTLSDSMQSDTE